MKTPQSWVQRHHDILMSEWNGKAESLRWILREGGGVENVHVLSVLRDMTALYERIAAHREAIREGQS